MAVAYVSPMRRARETAEIALAGTAIARVPLEDLRELSLGEWEGRTVDEVRALEGDPYHAWVRAPLDCPPPGGELWRLRIDNGSLSIARPPRLVCVNDTAHLPPMPRVTA